MLQIKSKLHSKGVLQYAPTEHGGNIYKLAEELGIPESKLIDFSASINPLGISGKVKDAIIKNLDGLINYPDPDMRILRETLSGHHGIDPETILCANGSTEFIYLIPRALKPKKVLVPAPTFSEYERACKISRGEAVLRPYKLKKEDNFEINPDKFISAIRRAQSSVCINSKLKIQNSKRPCDMAFLCNPNNPTGHFIKKNDVLRVAEAARDMKCVLVVDEAFIDFRPEESVIGHVQDNPYLIVLRSMTKFYALTGLRIDMGFPANLISR
jgi:threonine-phosphate decarboxylase